MATEHINSAFDDEIEKAIVSHYPVVYIISPEESRVAEILGNAAKRHFDDGETVNRLFTWTASRGLDNASPAGHKLNDPIEALNHIASQGEDGFYLMKDLPAEFATNPHLVRHLRDFYYQMAERNIYLFLTHPEFQMPEQLKKEVYSIELKLPDDKEIYQYLLGLIQQSRGQFPVTSAWLTRFSQSLRGPSLNEIRHLFLRLKRNKNFDIHNALEEAYHEKSQMLLKEGCLRVVPNETDIDGIGGLQRLKTWVHTRRNLLSKQARDEGIPLPSGILFMGISGCGKSLAAKTIAASWDLQLVRLDMNLVLSGIYGSPEYAFDRATRTAESIAPVVLWIDEIENSFGYDDSGGSGSNVNVFSSFLTWMQEKPASVFVAATANQISKLPAEMIRKGRFDQVFFIDLPDEEARAEIFKIHISANGGNPRAFDYLVLQTLTTGWSGAEIEQVVKAARIEAFNGKREFTQQDIALKTASIIPLSKTMKEQMNRLRSWSMDRATAA